MYKSIKSVLSPTSEVQIPSSAGYESIRGGNEEDEELQRVLSPVDGSSEKDDGKGVYWAFWSLGAGVLLSWNVLICTIPLLASFFPKGSTLHRTLASYLSTTFCFSNLFFLGLAQREVGKSSPSPRLHKALLLLLVLSLLLTFPLLPIILPLLSDTAFLLPLLLLVTLLLATSTAYLQSAVFALAALWSTPAVLGVMSGQGGIAVIVSGTQVILAVISALHTRSSPYPGGTDDPSDIGGEGGESKIAGVGLWALGAVGAFGCMLAHRFLVRHEGYGRALGPALHRREDGDVGKGGRGKTRRLLRVNWEVNLAVAWVFVVTLALLPPITTTIVSVRKDPPVLLKPAVFIPFHFFLFNIGDYLGRTYLPQIPLLLITSPPRILLLSLSRTLFIPLFLLCNISPTQTSPTPYINSDTLYFLILLFFGTTNGYISSLSMITASSPSLNSRIVEEEKDVAGTLAAFCLVAGLAGGSLCSFGVTWLVSGSVFG